MGSIHCFFCGGKNCKYENYYLWNGEKNTHPAIPGLYSNWITDDLMAIARPSTRIVKEHNILQQFTDASIRAIVNLQQAGEHANCGDGLDGDFSYRPQDFMDVGIFYYNFAWKDMTTPSLDMALNVSQVMWWTIHINKQKVAVHCHAGLGRTGLVCACYLVLCGMKPAAAIILVRSKRPGSIQNRAQEKFVHNFAAYVADLRILFALGNTNKFTLQKALARQRRFLHGLEQQRLRFLPKIVDAAIVRLTETKQQLETAQATSSSQWTSLQTAQSNTDKLLHIKTELNKSNWQVINREEDGWVLFVIVLEWFCSLKEPVVPQSSMATILTFEVDHSEAAVTKILNSFPKETIYTIGGVLDLVRLLLPPASVSGSLAIRSELFLAAAQALLGISVTSTTTDKQSRKQDVELLSRLLENISTWWQPPVRTLSIPDPAPLDGDPVIDAQTSTPQPENDQVEPESGTPTTYSDEQLSAYFRTGSTEKLSDQEEDEEDEPFEPSISVNDEAQLSPEDPTDFGNYAKLRPSASFIDQSSGPVSSPSVARVKLQPLESSPRPETPTSIKQQQHQKQPQQQHKLYDETDEEVTLVWSAKDEEFKEKSEMELEANTTS